MNENVLGSSGNSAQVSVVTQMGKKSKKKKAYMYTYSWFTLLYSQNIVKQLYSRNN